MARLLVLALCGLALCAGVAQAHETEGCSFPANVSSRADLAVAGAALTALDGSNLVGSHDTVFLPNDAAFADLLTVLNVSTPAELLADFQNQTVAILAYHVLPSERYLNGAALIGNGSIETALGELATEASGSNVTYPLRFRRVSTRTGRTEVIAAANNATIVTNGVDICGRFVYVIDTVLLPEADPADIPTDIPEVVAARTAAELAEEEAAESPAGSPAAAPDQGASASAAVPLLALGALGASLLLQAL